MSLLVAMLLAQAGTSPSPTTNHVSFSAQLNYCPGFNASIDAYHGIATGGPIGPNAPGIGIEILGRRADRVAQVSVQSTGWVDGGIQFAVNFPRPCNFSLPAILAVGVEGNIHFGRSAKPDCSGDSSVLSGGLIDDGVPGHISLRASEGLHPTIAGDLGNWKNCAMLVDGGHPNPTDYPVGWVVQAPDGGYCFPYAGTHGNVTLGTTSLALAGQIVTFDNNGHPEPGAYWSHRAGIDHNGGYWQAHGLHRDQFPSPYCETTVVYGGAQYRYMMPGQIMWAVDTKHWYFTDCTQWVQFAEQADMNAMIVSNLLLEARIAALEAQ